MLPPPPRYVPKTKTAACVPSAVSTPAVVPQPPKRKAPTPPHLLPPKPGYKPSTVTGPVVRWEVVEWFKRDWRGFAVIPANCEAQAIEKARRMAMRPKERPMKAHKLKVTKQ